MSGFQRKGLLFLCFYLKYQRHSRGKYDLDLILGRKPLKDRGVSLLSVVLPLFLQPLIDIPSLAFMSLLILPILQVFLGQSLFN
ncbi:hypothetical protein LOAG_18600, partial [Loa loa]